MRASIRRNGALSTCTVYVVVGMRDRLPSLMLRCAHECRFTAGSRMCRAQVLARSRTWLDRVRAAWAWVPRLGTRRARVDRVFVVAGLENYLVRLWAPLSSGGGVSNRGGEALCP